jgi:hypothetical protein
MELGFNRKQSGDFMTHDELLAKLSNDENGYAGSTPLQRLYALRAIVELHKPMFIETEGGEFALCSDCSRRVDLPGYGIQYPCKTIQAIEKELK